jgi:hypothetical protein
MGTPALDTQPLAAWMAALDQIDRAVAAALEKAVEPGPAPAAPPAGRPPLEGLGERLARLQETLDRCAAKAAAADAALAAEATALQDWRQKIHPSSTHHSHRT